MLFTFVAALSLPVCSDDWKVLWSFRDPFYAHHPSFEYIKSMRPGQKVRDLLTPL